MARPRKDTTSGPKLTPEARRVLIGRVVAGDSNQQILDYLADAGYPSDLNRSTLAYYRKLEEVTEAVSEINIEHSQSALAVRGRRIRILSNLVLRLELKLGLSDNGRSAGRLKEKIEIGAASPLEADESEDTRAKASDESAELTVRETCELTKALVVAMTALNQLLDSNATAATGRPSALANALGAYERPALTDKVETKASKRALLNDILEEAIREEEEERAAQTALSEIEQQAEATPNAVG